MAIDFAQNRKQVIDQMQSDIQSELPNSAPTLRNSYLNSLTVAYGGAVYERILEMMEVMRALFPNTATGQELDMWGSFRNITINPAFPARGFITLTGTNGSLIADGSIFQSPDGNQYTSQSAASITYAAYSVESITFDAGTVTVKTASDHLFASNIEVTIAGADQSDYNGTFTIFVTAADEFTYDITGTPTTPGTGTVIASAYLASVEILSNGYGLAQNLDQGASLTVTTPISGVNPTGYVQFGTVSGGADQESPEEYRTRILYAYSHPNTPFNEAEIKYLAKTITGVTRVFVEGPDATTGHYDVTSITRTDDVAIATTAIAHGLVNGQTVTISGADQVQYNLTDTVIIVLDDTRFAYVVKNDPATPATGTLEAAFASVQPGQVKVLFTRDNDPSIIPTGAEVLQVYNKLLTIKPAHMAARDLIVLAPVPVPVNFNFNLVVPNTPTMKQAIIDTLDAFFRESNVAGQDLLKIEYTALIYSTVDTVSGELIKNFALTTPTVDITIQSGQIPVLGTVTFS